MAWMLNKPPLAVQTEARKQALRKKRAGTADAFLYWMEMGLGKTGTVLNEFAEAFAKKQVDFLMVVTLNSFKRGWVDEAANFGLQLKLGVWPDCRGVPPKAMDGVIFNYEAIIGAGGDYMEQLIAQRKVYIAFDECHKIKTHSSAVTKRSMQLWKDTAMRRGLTGTPMSNNVMDLFPQLKLGGGLEGDNPYVFRNRYATMGGYMGKTVTGIKKDKLPDLHRLMDRHSFRATKKDWLDLPEQSWHTPYRVDMPPSLKKRYKEMQDDFVLELGDETSITAEMVISQMLKLQQISSGFVYDNEKKVHHLERVSMMPKYEVVSDLMTALEGQSKLIVFAHFRPTIERLRVYIKGKMNIEPCIFMGGMKADQIAAQKAAFNSDEGPDILLAQTSVGSATHTLLGGPNKPCYSTLFFENDYNKIDRMQAESRNHRNGQKYPVDYYDIISSPAEAKPIKALQAKGDLIRAIVEGIQGI